MDVIQTVVFFREMVRYFAIQIRNMFLADVLRARLLRAEGLALLAMHREALRRLRKHTPGA